MRFELCSLRSHDGACVHKSTNLHFDLPRRNLTIVVPPQRPDLASQNDDNTFNHLHAIFRRQALPQERSAFSAAALLPETAVHFPLEAPVKDLDQA